MHAPKNHEAVPLTEMSCNCGKIFAEGFAVHNLFEEVGTWFLATMDIHCCHLEFKTRWARDTERKTVSF
jgi:hypothetical protein